MIGNWQALPDGQEKYHAYLASREWSLKKEAVRNRSGGTCERCKHYPAENVHHRTYIRKYREDLGDLWHVCWPCHQFLHAKVGSDPILSLPITLWGREIQSVYLAGKIAGKAGYWRNEIVPAWSEENHGQGEVELGDWASGHPHSFAGLGDGRRLRYSGPFWSSAVSYQGGHGDVEQNAQGLHANGYPSEDGRSVMTDIPLLACEIREAISRSDLVFAWMDSRDAYGTFAELGYARGLQKGLMIVAAMPVYDRELWLVVSCAHRLILAPTAADAWRDLWADPDPDLRFPFRVHAQPFVDTYQPTYE